MTDDTDRPDLPPGWRWARLGSLGKWGSGGTPKRTTSTYYGGDIPWLKIGDLDDGPVQSAETSITASGLASSSAKLVPPGTLLVAMYGSIGKLGITRFECATNQAIAHLRVDDSLATAQFLYFALLRYRQDLIRLGKGGTQQNISQTVLKGFEIELPPLDEQQRIVDAIESVFADLDAGVAALAEARAGLDRYRQSVLKAAVEGALTADWRAAHPDAEPASALLARVAGERRAQWEADQLAKYEAKGKMPPKSFRQRYKPAAETETDGLAELPDGWAWATLEQITDGGRLVQYGVLKPGKDYEGGIPYVKVMNMRGDRIDVGGLRRTTPEIAAKYERASLRPGDVLLSIRGTYGRVAEVPDVLAGGNITQDSVRIAPASVVDRDYLAVCLRSPHAQAFFHSVSKGAAVQGVNVGDVRLTPIPLPPLAEQAAVVEAVEERLSVADAVAADLDRQRDRAERLRRSVLHRAFTGGLVPQDPAESAGSPPADGDRQQGAAEAWADLMGSSGPAQTTLDFGA